MAETIVLDKQLAVSELRRQMKTEFPKEIYDDTILLLKFLKARNFNVNQAEIMLRKNLRWKKEMQIDTILKDFKPPEILTKHFNVSLIGYDNEGCPVYYIAVGASDGRGIFKSTNYIYFLKYFVQILQKDIGRQKLQTEKLGRPINQSIYVYNMENLDFSQVTHKQSVQNSLKGMMVFQDNYPELLKTVYVINASVYFAFIWPVLKKCLGQGLMEKINIYGPDGWQEEFQRIMDADKLPSFLGGKRTDPDGNPMCLSIINHTGPVPKSCYLEKDINNFALKPGVKSVKIERQTSASVRVHITNPESILNWEFEIKCQDIGFGLLLESTDGTRKELIPLHKMRTELEPFSGMYRCENPGNYDIVFDNTHSWIYHKEIYYRTWITETNDDHIEQTL